MDNKRQCRELPEQVISYILSKAPDARYVAVASAVCKSWNRSSMLITTLKFSDSGEPVNWYKMIIDRLHSLENIELGFNHAQEFMLYLGAACACQRLSHLELDLEAFEGSLVSTFNALSASKNLASLVLWSHREAFVDGACMPLLRLKKLKLCGSSGGARIEVTSRDFWLSFPALEELQYRMGEADTTSVLDIHSNTLRKLEVYVQCCDYLRVKSPSLTSITVSGVEIVRCEGGATVSYFEIEGAWKVISDAAHVKVLKINGLKLMLLKSVHFPKLVSVQTLIYKMPDSFIIDMLPTAALASVETATLYASYPSNSQVRSGCVSFMKQVKSLSLTLGIIDVNQTPLCLPQLKSVRYVVTSTCDDPSPTLDFIVESSPALELVEIFVYVLPYVGTVRENGGEVMRMFHRLFQLKHSKPELIVNVTYDESFGIDE